MKSQLKTGDIVKNGYGNNVEIIKVLNISVEGGYHIIGLRYPSDGEPDLTTYTITGKYHLDGRESGANLVLPPLAQKWSTVIGYPIELHQDGEGDFDVVYGKQIDRGLSYRDAAEAIGLAVMHALAAEGRIFTAEDYTERRKK